MTLYFQGEICSECIQLPTLLRKHSSYSAPTEERSYIYFSKIKYYAACKFYMR